MSLHATKDHDAMTEMTRRYQSRGLRASVQAAEFRMLAALPYGSYHFDQNAADQRPGENSQTPSGKGNDACSMRSDFRCALKHDPQMIRRMTRVCLDRCTAY